VECPTGRSLCLRDIPVSRFPIARSISGCGAACRALGVGEITAHGLRHSAAAILLNHVVKNSVCIYSQLKACSSSEVAAMIEGVLRHDTKWTSKSNMWIPTDKVK
jgi:integrase